MNINQKQIDSVLILSGSQRYKYFIKKIVDWEEVWGLYNEGWALAGDENDIKTFPVWPAKEYAQLCAKNEWKNYKPEMISLAEFIDELLPTLKKDGVFLSVFNTPNNVAVTPSIDQILEDINTELANY